jgi:hypothetical protein
MQLGIGILITWVMFVANITESFMFEAAKLSSPRNPAKGCRHIVPLALQGNNWIRTKVKMHADRASIATPEIGVNFMNTSCALYSFYVYNDFSRNLYGLN